MVAASLSTNLLSTTKPIKDFKSFTIPSSQTPKFLIKRGSGAGAVKAVANDEQPIKSNDVSDHQVGNLVSEIERGGGGDGSDQDLQLIGGLSFEGGLISGDGSDHDLQLIGGLSFEGGLISGDGNEGVVVVENEDIDKFMDRAINATIVLAVGTFGITKLLTIDYDYWHGWTIYEILRYAPQHNWSAYEEALRENPLLIKMMISGAVYSIGDWIAQCCEGKPLLEVDRTRMLRSGIVGFSLQGSLSHYYYNFCEALFPFHDWWLVPVKVAFDQTAWAGLWNIIYFVAVGLLRFESPFILFGELKETFWPMLTAGWKLWPFAHIITYGVVPIEHRLLWVDCVELIWVTILSTMSNEKSEARISDTPTDPMPVSSLESSEE